MKHFGETQACSEVIYAIHLIGWIYPCQWGHGYEVENLFLFFFLRIQSNHVAWFGYDAICCV